MDLSDRLAEIEERYERLQAEMAEPDVARDQDRLRRLGKDLAELGEIVAPYREYRTSLQQAEEARSLAKEETDAKMAGFLREEAETAGASASELRSRLEALLVPRDPNDGKDVVVEIRAGAGGDEAALFAGDLHRMLTRYAERKGFKTEDLGLSAKRLEYLKEAVPRLSRVALLINPNVHITKRYVEESEPAASRLGLTLQLFEARTDTIMAPRKRGWGRESHDRVARRRS